jgi:hypothetical protein
VAAAVVAVPALAVLAQPQVVVGLALLPVRVDLVLPVLVRLLPLPVLAHLLDLPLPQAVAALAHLRVGAVLAAAAVPLPTRSFSAAMAGISRSPGRPMYAPVPRSRRKPKRRPCPST